MLAFFRRNHFLEYVLLVFATVFLFAPILYLEIFVAYNTDYGSHIYWAQNIYAFTFRVPPSVIAHSSWQWLLLLIHVVLNLKWNFEALLVSVASLSVVAVFIYSTLRRNLNGLLSGVLVMAVMISAPILLIHPFMTLWHMANGYLGTNVYHNPTILLLKPLALFQFFMTLHFLHHPKSKWYVVLIAMLVSGLAVFTKPNLIICLLPAIGLLVFIKILKKEPVDWPGLIIGITLPSLAILVWQFLITYSPNSNDGVIFSPFQVMNSFSDYLLPKFLLSIAFPMVVALSFWKSVIHDKRMQLGWFTFFFGAMLTYFFAESGNRENAGNFVWSAEISLFILFVCCLIFLSENKHLLKRAFHTWPVVLTGILHVVYGFFYYFYIYFAWLPSV